MSPFRICHLATSVTDGAGIATQRIHDSLLAAGTDSRLIVHSQGNIRSATSVLAANPLAWHERIVRRLPVALTRDLRHERTLSRLLTGSRPQPELFSLPYARTHPENHAWVKEADILHLHWISGFVDYTRFFANVRKPVVWTLHDQQPYLGGFHYELDRRAHPAFRAIEEECLAIKRAALARLPRPPLVLGNSRWNTDAARASGFFPAGTHFETIYYPLDFSAYAPREKTAAKIALGIAPGERVVGFACTGLDNTRKGLADLLEALRLLENTPGHSPVTLVSFGRAPSETLRASLRSRWLHLGFLDTDLLKCAAYSAMDCFVIPSHAEAFGQTAIEALASGTCVIGAQVGGIPETLPDSSHSEALVPAANPAALAERLRSLLTAPARLATLAGQGRDHVLRQHDSARIAAQLTRLYTDLASNA